MNTYVSNPDRDLAALRHRIAVAEAAAGPVGRNVERDHLAEFNPWLKEIAACREAIKAIEARIG